MYVAAIGAATAGSWITSVPVIRNVRKSVTDAINPFSVSGTPANPLLDIVTLSLESNQYSGEVSTPAYIYNALYFMYPNQSIRDFAHDVIGVKVTDSNDTKMSKIARWVQNHIRYKEDIENYGYNEFWAPPVFTLTKGSGDCEDGAFLIMSLALNAGVPGNRLRMYGGVVKAGEGAATGGHGWVGYLRESDSQWIPVDFSYYPNPNISSIKPMSEDIRYIDDYFFISAFEFVETPGTNRVRDPEGYDSMGKIKAQIWIGSIINNYV
jgi:tetrahydromethanopterin S-methyltransferase subunit F